jgi:hypothetical protein
MATSRLPQETVDYLKAWMMSPPHINHPYPTEKEKAKIMAKTGIEPKQLTKWFENNRKRYWKPRVEAKLQMNYYIMMPPPPPLQHPSLYNQQPIAMMMESAATQNTQQPYPTCIPYPQMSVSPSFKQKYVPLDDCCVSSCIPINVAFHQATWNVLWQILLYNTLNKQHHATMIMTMTC